MKPVKQLILSLLASALLASPSWAAASHNLTSDTILANFGLQNLEYSYRVSEHVTVGLIGSSTSRHITNHGIQLNGNSYGAVMRYYLAPAFQNDTWYVMGSATKTNFEARIVANGVEYAGKADDMMALGLGYHWFWKSFNIALGAVFQTPSKIEVKDAAGNKYQEDFNTNIGVELKIGGMF